MRDNVKRIYRLYREQGLSLRHKRPKHNKAAQARHPKSIADYANQTWNMDFVADNFFDGKKLRMLTVVDGFTRECLAFHVGQSLKGEAVVRIDDTIAARRGVPQSITRAIAASSSARRSISGIMNTTSCSISVDQANPPKNEASAHANVSNANVKRSGRNYNAMVESFSGRLREACLNGHRFMRQGASDRFALANQRGRSPEQRDDAAATDAIAVE